MTYTKEEVIKRITEQLDDCLEYQNAEVLDWRDKILDVNLQEQTITIKLHFHIVEEDDYIGLGCY